jgi:hypothetical protein
LVERNYGEPQGRTPTQIREKTRGRLLFRDGCPAGETPGKSARERIVIERVPRVEGDVTLFAYGRMLCVLVARWVNCPQAPGGMLLGYGRI